MMKRWLTRMAFLGLGVVIASALAAIAVDVGWQRQRLANLAITFAEDATGVEIEIESVAGRASRGLELRNVRIVHAGAPLLAIDRARVRWNLASLFLREEFVVSRIEIEGFRAWITRERDGSWRGIDAIRARLAETAASPSDSEATRPIRIRAIDIGRGRIDLQLAIDDPEEGEGDDPEEFIEIPLEARGSLTMLRLGGSIPASFERASLGANTLRPPALGDLPPPIRDARITLELAEREIVAAELVIEGQELDARATAAGNLDRLGPLAITIESSDLSRLTPWSSMLPRLPAMKGQLGLSGEFHESEGGWLGTLHADGRDLSVDALQARTLALDASSETPIDLRNLDFEALVGEVTIRATGVDQSSASSRWGGPLDGDLDLDLRIDRGRVHLARSRFEGRDGSRAEARGTFDSLEIERLNIDLDVPNVARWLQPIAALRPLGLSGPVTGNLDLRGPVSAPIGRVELTSAGLLTKDGRTATLDLEIERDPRGPAELELTLGEAFPEALRLASTIDLETRRVDFRAEGALAWTAFLMVDPPALEGSARLSGWVDADRPDSNFDLVLDAADVRVDDRSVGRIGISAATPRPGTVEIDRLEIEGPSNRLALLEPATVVRDGPSGWNLIAPRIGIGQDPDTAPQSTGDDTTEAPPVASVSPDQGFVALRAVGEGARPTQWEVTLSDLPASFAGPLLDEAPRLGGVLSGSTRGEERDRVLLSSGALTWLDPVVGRSSISRIDLDWNSKGNAVDGRITANVADERVMDATVEGRWLEGLSFAENFDRTRIEAKLSDFDLELVSPLIPRTARDLSGLLSGQLERAPSATGPRYAGEIRLRAGGITIPILRHRFAPIDGLVRIEGERLLLERLDLGRAGAGATLTGEIELDRDADHPIRASLDLDSMPVSRSSLLHADIEGAIQIAGNLAAPEIRGTLALEQTRLRVPAADDAVLREIQIVTRDTDDDLVEPTEEDRDLLARSTIDVALRIPETTRVRGQGAHLYVKGKGRISAEPGSPLRVTGDAEVQNGTYTLQGRRFRVRRGEVVLTGDANLDPVLNVEAHLPVADILAIVEITGRLSEPIVRMRSEPVKSEQDVLAYLIFGRPAEDVGAAEGGRFNAAAARLLAGVAEREVREILGDAMPIDSIEIGADDQGNTSELGVGKYLGPNLYLRYVHILGDEPADQVGIEFRINDLLSVGSSVSTSGDAGADLILRKDF